MSKRPRSESDSAADGPSHSLAANVAQNVSTADLTENPTQAFIKMLDMTAIAPGTEPAHFELIATRLMQGFHLCVASKATPPVINAYEFLEVEFYWYCHATGHYDPFTHAAEEQRQAGNWYFHRAPRRAPLGANLNAPIPSLKTAGYRSGTRKGLDLTFGIPAGEDGPEAYGGILLRALRNVDTKNVTCGPSLLTDEVLRAAGADSIPDLVNALWSGNTSAFLSTDQKEPRPSQVFLQPVPDPAPGSKPPAATRMYTSPRIGLDLNRLQTVAEAKPSHPRIKFVGRPYRFFMQPRLLGTPRPQTVYGLLLMCDLGVISRAQLIDVLAIKPTQLDTFIGYINDGRKAGKDGIKEFLGEKGKGAAQSVQKFLKMAGVLECILDLKKDPSDQGSSAKKQKLGKTLTELFGPKKS